MENMTYFPGWKSAYSHGTLVMGLKLRLHLSEARCEFRGAGTSLAQLKPEQGQSRSNYACES